MKSLFLAIAVTFCVLPTLVLASDYPLGDLLIYNASNKTVTAQISDGAFSKVNISAKEQKNVSYSTLSKVCSSTPTRCTAQFYVDDVPAGSATINTITGKLVHLNLVKVKAITSESQHVLRSVVIK